MIASGLLWYDDDTHRHVALKIAEAAERYRERVGFEPTTCELNPAQAAEAAPTKVDSAAGKTRKRSTVPPVTLRLESNEHLKPNYFLVGVAEGDALKRVSGWRGDELERIASVPIRRAPSPMRPADPQAAPPVAVSPTPRRRAVDKSVAAASSVAASRIAQPAKTAPPTAASAALPVSAVSPTTPASSARPARTVSSAGPERRVEHEMAAKTATSAPASVTCSGFGTPAKAIRPATPPARSRGTRSEAALTPQGKGPGVRPSIPLKAAKTARSAKRSTAPQPSPKPAAHALPAPERRTPKSKTPAETAIAHSTRRPTRPVKRAKAAETAIPVVSSVAPAASAKSAPSAKRATVPMASPAPKPATSRSSSRVGRAPRSGKAVKTAIPRSGPDEPFRRGLLQPLVPTPAAQREKAARTATPRLPSVVTTKSAERPQTGRRRAAHLNAAKTAASSGDQRPAKPAAAAKTAMPRRVTRPAKRETPTKTATSERAPRSGKAAKAAKTATPVATSKSRSASVSSVVKSDSALPAQARLWGDPVPAATQRRRRSA
jgi:hypothetical protein